MATGDWRLRADKKRRPVFDIADEMPKPENLLWKIERKSLGNFSRFRQTDSLRQKVGAP